MSYLTRNMAISALKRMKSFHDGLALFYADNEMDVLEDLGRRNILMSTPQEKYFADELATTYHGASNDGRPGQPDIIIPDLEKELECKLTSRHKSGAISFQTDFETLRQKGSLDYLYVIGDEKFEKFAVLHFEGLTVDDFRSLSNGSRGKVSMFKHVAMSKCNMLVGNAVSVNDVNIEKLKRKIGEGKLSKGKHTRALKSLEYWQNTPTKYSFELESVS